MCAIRAVGAERGVHDLARALLRGAPDRELYELVCRLPPPRDVPPQVAHAEARAACRRNDFARAQVLGEGANKEDVEHCGHGVSWGSVRGHCMDARFVSLYCGKSAPVNASGVLSAWSTLGAAACLSKSTVMCIPLDVTTSREWLLCSRAARARFGRRRRHSSAVER